MNLVYRGLGRTPSVVRQVSGEAGVELGSGSCLLEAASGYIIQKAPGNRQKTLRK